MQAERLILETDDTGRLLGIPDLPPRRQVEAIFPLLPEKAGANVVRRQPPSELAGKAKIIGDITAPVIDESEWDALR